MGSGAAFGIRATRSRSTLVAQPLQSSNESAIRKRLLAARRPVVITGAGVSIPSGLPSLRNPTTGEDAPGATGPVTESRLEVLWGLWDRFRRVSAAAAPNPAHDAITEWDAWLRNRHHTGVTVITLNVDGLHQRSGTQNVIEVHGSVYRGLCLTHRHATALNDAMFAEVGSVPNCPDCKSPLRPDITLTGERPGYSQRHDAEAAVRAADLVLAVGTSGQVTPSAMLVEAAARAGTPCVLVNKEPWTDRMPFVAGASGDAAVVLPMLCPTRVASDGDH